jgi:ribonuclease HII
MCVEWDAKYPEYGLAIHKGYATKHHREMLLRYGPTPLHRKLFIRNVMAQLEEKENVQESEQLELDLI